MDRGSDERGWRSYDSVADTYADVESLRNAVTGRDLVALVAPRFGGRILDVGTGAGAAAQAAVSATGPDGVVVAVDPAQGLLRRVAPRARIGVAAAVAAALPARDSSFDGVVANLVLHHVPDYDAALSEMVRVARPGGRVGVTTGGVLGDTPVVDNAEEQAAVRVWTEEASRIVALDAVRVAAEEVLPWADWFSDPRRLRAALDDAGLRRVELTGRAYRSWTSHAEWLRSMQTTAPGRYLRGTVRRVDWESFGERVLARLRDSVPDPFERVDHTLFAVGTVASAVRRS